MLLLIFSVLLFAQNGAPSETTLEEKIIEKVNSLMKQRDAKIASLEDKLLLIEEQCVSVKSEGAKNISADLENRVIVLELEMDLAQADAIILYDDVEELRNQDSLNDLRLRTIEEQLAEPWNACESSPCANGATCVDVNVGTFICSCRDGFFGTDCSSSYGDFSFLATSDMGDITPVPTPVVFNFPKYNIGGHYDPNTGVYTVPVDGIYLFTANLRGQNEDDIVTKLVVDGIKVAHMRNSVGASDFDNLATLLSISLHVTAGQEIWVEADYLVTMYGSSDNGQFMHSWFSASLISAD